MKKEVIKRYVVDSQTLYKVSFMLMGHRVRKQPFYSRLEASAYVDRIRFLIISGQYEEYLKTELDVDVPTFSELLKRCTKTRSWKIQKQSKEMYIGILNRWFKPTIGSMKISHITQQNLYTIKGAMMDAGLVPMTISSQMAAYYSVMRMGIEFGYIDSYPSVVIKVERSKQRLFVSPKMLRDIVKTINEGRPEHYWLTAYVMTQYYLVARAGEVMALTWDDVDLEERTIVINKHIYRGKVLEGTKNKITNNAFPIHPELMPFLKEQVLRTGKTKYVFPATAYYKSTHKDATSSVPMYSCSQILKLLDVVGKALAIPYKLTTHAFRRGAADYMLRSGMTIHQVAYAMRTSTENLIRSYSVVNESAFVEKYLNHFSTKNVQNNDDSANVVPITKGADTPEAEEN